MSAEGFWWSFFLKRSYDDSWHPTLIFFLATYLISFLDYVAVAT
jgi:hypothetical protein